MIGKKSRERKETSQLVVSDHPTPNSSSSSRDTGSEGEKVVRGREYPPPFPSLHRSTLNIDESAPPPPLVSIQDKRTGAGVCLHHPRYRLRRLIDTLQTRTISVSHLNYQSLGLKIGKLCKPAPQNSNGRVGEHCRGGRGEAEERQEGWRKQ